MMKKIVFTCILAVLGMASVFAQRVAFVDSDFILKHMPEYNSAIKELNAMSLQWQSEVDKLNKEVQELKQSYTTDRTILTSEMRKSRESEILNKEQEALRYQQEKFGPEGALFQLRAQLIKPIQNRVAAAIKQVATDKRVDMIFDRNSDATSILFGAPNYDYSKLVIEKMGYKSSIKEKFNNIINQ